MLSLMTWNWQKPDWPHFSWEKIRLAKAEEQFLLESGVVGSVGSLRLRLKHWGIRSRASSF